MVTFSFSRGPTLVDRSPFLERTRCIRTRGGCLRVEFGPGGSPCAGLYASVLGAVLGAVRARRSHHIIKRPVGTM